MTGGVDAISLRAIAGDMGMTAPAIYRYFPSLEALVAGRSPAACSTSCGSAGSGPGTVPVPSRSSQLLALFCPTSPGRWRARRVGRPRRPVPGRNAFVEGCVTQSIPAPLGAVFIQPILDLLAPVTLPHPARELLRQRLGGRRLEPLRLSHGDVPIEVAYAFLSGWTHLCGLVTMEVFHQLTGP